MFLLSNLFQFVEGARDSSRRQDLGIKRGSCLALNFGKPLPFLRMNTLHLRAACCLAAAVLGTPAAAHSTAGLLQEIVFIADVRHASDTGVRFMRQNCFRGDHHANAI